MLVDVNLDNWRVKSVGIQSISKVGKSVDENLDMHSDFLDS